MMMSLMSIFLSVAICSLIAVCNAYNRIPSKPNHNLPIKNIDKRIKNEDKQINISQINRYPLTHKKLRSIVATLLCTLSLALPDISDAAMTTSNLSGGAQLEEAIVKLEGSTTRAETLQSMADLYEIVRDKTLLTRTKYKYRVVNAVNERHKILNNEWDQAMTYAGSELKRQADPLRTVDLKPYLSIAPVVGGIAYLSALFVLKALPELFPLAYPIAVFAFAAPIAFVILAT